jgi:hypothetical protein
LLSDPDAHPRGHQGWPCAIHGWDCPNQAAPVHDPSSSSRQEEEEGGEDEDDERQISVVTGPIGASVIRRMTRISIGPRGRPQGSLAPRTATNLANPFPRNVGTTVDTSFKRGRPFGLRDATGSEKSMRQLAAPLVRPPHRPIRQWLSAQVVELDDRAKPISGPRKRGSGVEEHGQVEKVRCRRRSPSGRARGGGLDLATANLHRRRS